MPKKSRSRAARYSELSRTAKKKQHEKDYSHLKIDPADIPQSKPETPGTGAAPRTFRPSAKPSGEVAGLNLARVRLDLRKIGIISGSIIIVLIILSFVL